MSSKKQISQAQKVLNQVAKAAGYEEQIEFESRVGDSFEQALVKLPALGHVLVRSHSDGNITLALNIGVSGDDADKVAGFVKSLTEKE